MFCNQCGSMIPEQSDFCPECGCKVRKQKEAEGFGHNNIFTGIAREKSRGSYLEFVIWILVCLSVVIGLLAEVLMQNSTGSLNTAVFVNFRVFWIFVILLAAGLGVSMALRLRVLTIYAGSIAYFFVLLIAYFICESKMAKMTLYNMGAGSNDTPNIMKALFLLALLIGIGLVAVCSVQVFTRYQLGKITAILSICAVVFTLFLAVASYVVPYMQVRSYFEKQYEEYYGENEEMDLSEYMSGYVKVYQTRYATVKNGFGTLAYLLVCLSVTLYNVFFFFGLIDNRRQKFIRFSCEGMNASAEEMQWTGAIEMDRLPMLRGITGSYAGQLFPAQEELIIGSQPSYAHIIIQDGVISPQHCSIRFNPSNNCYEVKDLSETGTYISNGQKLAHGVYTTCSRGTVIYLGSEKQQFLMQ